MKALPRPKISTWGCIGPGNPMTSSDKVYKNRGKIERQFYIAINICGLKLNFLQPRWFMQHLIDGDLAANNGGWQWCASTGTDSVPYFRIFNPVTQSKRFDPNGTFIRHYVPELAHLADKDIHLPSNKNKPENYPHPIVDLKLGRLRALSAFKEV